MYPSIINKDLSITVHLPGGPKTVLSDNPRYQEIKDALVAGNYDLLPDLMDPVQAVQAWAGGKVEVQANGTILVDGKPMESGALTDKLLSMWREGFPIDPYTRFYEKLQQLTSYRMRKVLYSYLEKHSFPLYPDGDFMAYKGVKENPYKGKQLSDDEVQRIYKSSPQNPYTSVNGIPLSDSSSYATLLRVKDYVDCHSGSIPQSVGDTVEMDVRQVDDDPTHLCSNGLHIGSHSYTGTYYSTRLLVKASPNMVVSVPADCNNSKVRVAQYTIMKMDEVRVERTEAMVSTPPVDDEDEYEYDDDKNFFPDDDEDYEDDDDYDDEED